MSDEGKLHPECNNASNLYNESSEYCFKVIAETKPQTYQSQSAKISILPLVPCHNGVYSLSFLFPLVHGNKTDASPVITSFVTVMSGDDFSNFMGFSCCERSFKSNDFASESWSLHLRYSSELPSRVASAVSLADQFTFIEDSQGRRWNIAISSMDGSFAFHPGWNAFSLDNDLHLGNILVFTYIKGSHFAVKTYDNSGCEINAFETNQKKRKRDDRDPIFKGGWCYATDKSSISNEEGSVYNILGKDIGSTAIPSDGSELERTVKNSNVSVKKEKPSVIPSTEISGHLFATLPVILEENEETISTTTASATKKCCTGNGSGGDEGTPGYQTFRPELHPTFVVTMQDPFYLTTALKINLTFAEKYLARGSVKLQIPNGRTWPVICSITNKEEERTRYNREGVPRNRYPSYCIKAVLLSDNSVREEFTRLRYQGWIKFATDNGLQVGDTCVFEMIKQQPEVTLLVHIIRAV